MLYKLQCCGIHEINGISNHNAKDCLKNIYEDNLYKSANTRGGFLMFTARYGNGYHYGEDFRDYIRDYRLGNVVESNPRNNYRYLHIEKEHLLKIFIWEVDHDAFAEWYNKNFTKIDPNVG